MTMLKAGHGTALKAAKGSRLTIVNTEGEQCVDIWAFDSSDLFHNLSMERSRVILGKLRPSLGDTLYTNRREPIFRIVEDSSIGGHDTLLMACDASLYEKSGFHGHRNCTANLHEALADVGVTFPYTPGPLNLFANVTVDETLRMNINPCVARPGDRVVVELLMDAVVALSCCPCDIAPVNAADGRIRDVAFDLSCKIGQIKNRRYLPFIRKRHRRRRTLFNCQHSEEDMTYFTARIRARTVHIGYDQNGDLITRDLNKTEFVEKVIKLDRILSFTDDHLFVACPHNTVQVWDYEGDLKTVKEQLSLRNLLIE
jgi:uncharacterized protein YcgI (DUF1989 family)